MSMKRITVLLAEDHIIESSVHLTIVYGRVIHELHDSTTVRL